MSHLTITKCYPDHGEMARCPYCVAEGKAFAPAARKTLWILGRKLMHTCYAHAKEAQADYEGALDPVEEPIAA